MGWIMKKTIMAVLVWGAAFSYAFADAGVEEAVVPAAPVAENVAAAPAAESAAAAPAEAVSAEAKKVITDTTLRSEEAQSIIGKVDSIMPADLLTRPKSKITITDESGNQVEFTVKPLAVIYDMSGKIVALDEVSSGRKVQVHYKMLGGDAKEASSIKILE